MSILLGRDSQVLVQGITGHEGLFHSREMLEYGTNIVSGVTPGKGGEWVLEGRVPVFDTVREAVETTGANTSVVFVPARFAQDALLEAAEAGIRLLVCITKGIPVIDMVRITHYLKQHKACLIGPSCPGIITPGESKAGIIPGTITQPGKTGVVARSGTLMYEVLYAMKTLGCGASTCLSTGGDLVKGLNFRDVLELFEDDPQTENIILIGEIGGSDEEEAAQFIAEKMNKPVVALIAGQYAPSEKKMGHAGAIINGKYGHAGSKLQALREAGVMIANTPEEAAILLKENSNA